MTKNVFFAFCAMWRAILGVVADTIFVLGVAAVATGTYEVVTRFETASLSIIAILGGCLIVLFSFEFEATVDEWWERRSA